MIDRTTSFDTIRRLDCQKNRFSSQRSLLRPASYPDRRAAPVFHHGASEASGSGCYRQAHQVATGGQGPDVGLYVAPSLPDFEKAPRQALVFLPPGGGEFEEARLFKLPSNCRECNYIRSPPPFFKKDLFLTIHSLPSALHPFSAILIRYGNFIQLGQLVTSAGHLSFELGSAPNL